MTTTIYATFVDPDMATKAAGALMDHGVRSEHISIVLPEGYSQRDGFPEESAEHNQDIAERGITTTTGGDAAKGAAEGAGIGLFAGALAALVAVAIPGVGLVLGGGALALAVGGAAGATAAGAIAGGAAGYLKDQGLSDDQSAHYQRVLGIGGALLTVATTNEDVDPTTITSTISKYGGEYSEIAPQRARLL